MLPHALQARGSTYYDARFWVLMLCTVVVEHPGHNSCKLLVRPNAYIRDLIAGALEKLALPAGCDVRGFVKVLVCHGP